MLDETAEALAFVMARGASPLSLALLAAGLPQQAMVLTDEDPMLFSKADPSAAAFRAPTGTTLQAAADLWVAVAGQRKTIPAATPVTLPTLTAGTDYAIYATVDGRLVADASFSAPAGYAAATARRIGGFHFAPGGNAAAQAGGDTVPAINPYSLWDLKWRPAAADPRGMALIAGRFWADIYLLGVNWQVSGTSAYGVTLANGASPPKRSPLYGGDGTTAYGDLTWYSASEIMKSVGKDLPSYSEFSALAYGVTEGSSYGAATSSTLLDAPRTSKWGIMQAAGTLWVWSRECSYVPVDTNATTLTTGGWKDVVGGRGKILTCGSVGLSAAVFGNAWYGGVGAGSRAADWTAAPWASSSYIAARGVCNHLALV